MRFARRKRNFGFAFGGNNRLIDEIVPVAYSQIVEHEACCTKSAHGACLIPNGVCGFIDADGKPCGI